MPVQQALGHRPVDQRVRHRLGHGFSLLVALLQETTKRVPRIATLVGSTKQTLFLMSEWPAEFLKRRE